MKWFKEMNAQHQKLVEVMKERETAKAKDSAGGVGVRSTRRRLSSGGGGGGGEGDGEGGAPAGGEPNKARENDSCGNGGELEEEKTKEV